MLPEGSGELSSVAVSPLPAEVVARLAVVAEDWLGFYGLDIEKALYEGEDLFDIRKIAPSGSLYHHTFNSYYSGDDFCGPDYSPDRRRFVDLCCWGCDPDGVLDAIWDDSQDIYVVDREEELITLVQWFGTGAQANAAFWLDNDTFAIAGWRSYYKVGGGDDRPVFIDETHHFISVYDITGGTVRTLIFFSGKDGESEYGDYMEDVSLPAKRAERCRCRVYPVS